jgi:hypothetical protein
LLLLLGKPVVTLLCAANAVKSWLKRHWSPFLHVPCAKKAHLLVEPGVDWFDIGVEVVEFEEGVAFESIVKSGFFRLSTIGASFSSVDILLIYSFAKRTDVFQAYLNESSEHES